MGSLFATGLLLPIICLSFHCDVCRNLTSCRQTVTFMCKANSEIYGGGSSAKLEEA